MPRNNPSRHGPNKLTNYLDTHETILRQFVARGFVVSDGLVFSPFGHGLYIMTGALHCLGGIVIEVWKQLETVDGTGAESRVQTVAYSYNVKLQGVGNIVRYDSPHAHRPVHHVHRFTTLAHVPVETIEESHDGDWPTLGDVIVEAELWYYEHLDEIERTGNP